MSSQIKVVRKKKWTPYFSARGRRIFRPYEEFIDILWDDSGRYRICTRKHRRRKEAERHARHLTRAVQKGPRKCCPYRHRAAIVDSWADSR